jgi:RNA polymerase sigma-70 factor (ECF subfamily)
LPQAKNGAAGSESSGCGASGVEGRSLSELSDDQLLAGIRGESEQHFNELYERYFPRIYGFVHKRIRNHADAEEIVQETFITVFRSIDNYRGQSSLLSWIFGISKNLSNNTIRRSQNQQAKLGQLAPEALAPRPSIASAGPDEQYGMRCYAETIRLELAGLASWQTEIFEMRHLENLSISEIAQRVDRSSDAIRSSLYRVKRLMIESAERGQA